MFEGFAETGLCAFREVGQGDVEHVVLYATVLDARTGEVVGYIDQDASFVSADLVDEDWWCIGEDDMAVVGHGKFSVDKFESPEFAADLGLMWDKFFPKLGGVSVCNECDCTKKVILFTSRPALHTKHLTSITALYNICDGGLDNGNVRCRSGFCAQL